MLSALPCPAAAAAKRARKNKAVLANKTSTAICVALLQGVRGRPCKWQLRAKAAQHAGSLTKASASDFSSLSTYTL